MAKALGGFLILLIALAGLIYWFDYAEAPTNLPTQADEPQQHGRADIQSYVRENIAQLSPEPAVLGGTFYVTAIEAADGTGTVWYEDGHIALVADFTYIIDKYGITISSFEVRPQE